MSNNKKIKYDKKAYDKISQLILDLNVYKAIFFQYLIIVWFDVWEWSCIFLDTCCSVFVYAC